MFCIEFTIPITKRNVFFFLLSQKCGIKEAFKLMKYLGVLKHENLEKLLQKVSSSSVPRESVDMSYLLPDYEIIEKVYNYKFKNRLLLLQAFTHPSFTNNSMTDCYQRLEFIGDAVLGG